MKASTVVLLVFIGLSTLAVIYGVIVTSWLVIEIKTNKKHAQTIENQRDELERKEELLEKQKKYLDKLDNANTLSDYIAIWSELQNNRSNNNQ